MSTLAIKLNLIQTKLLWRAIAVLDAVSLGTVALSRGERPNFNLTGPLPHPTL